MEAFLDKIYSYDNFSLYLTIAIVVLVILFIIVLFFGKKDQKERELEATKKMQQLDGINGFKEENEPFKVEIPPQANVDAIPNEVKIENETVNNEVNVNAQEPKEDTIIMPVINNDEIELSPIEPEPISIPVVNEETPTLADQPVFNVEPEPITNDILFEPQPVFKQEVETPLVFNEEPKEVDVPDFNLDDILNTAEEVKSEEIKPEPKVEEVKTQPQPEVFSSVFAPKKSDDDLDMELPSLKQEEVKPEEIAKPVLNDYNLDELSGETYNINKD